VIPEGEVTLVFGLPEYIDGIVLQQGIGVFDEDGVVVPRRHASGDLRTPDDDQRVVANFLKCNLVGAVAIGVWDVILVWLILQMLGRGNGVKSVALGLLHANVRPNRAIREDGVDMQVALERQESGYIGELDAAIVILSALGADVRHHEQDKGAGDQ
jgi:hypothetical protein